MPGEKEGIIVEDSTFEDFCMIFKFICKASTDFSKKYVCFQFVWSNIFLSAKDVQNMHGKILALGIIHTVIGHSGPTLRYYFSMLYGY